MSSTLFRRSFLSLISTLELQAGLAKFQGFQTRYSYILGPFTLGLYTEGVRWLVDNADCGWLLNTILSEQNDPHNAIRKEPFQVWTLTVSAQRTAMLTAADGKGQVLMEMAVSSVELPVSNTLFWVKYIDQGPILLLPSEQ